MMRHARDPICVMMTFDQSTLAVDIFELNLLTYWTKRNVWTLPVEGEDDLHEGLTHGGHDVGPEGVNQYLLLSQGQE